MKAIAIALDGDASIRVREVGAVTADEMLDDRLRQPGSAQRAQHADL